MTDEPRLTAEQRQRWNQEIRGFCRSLVHPNTFEALCVAVDEQLAWLEAKHVHLTREVAELRNERDAQWEENKE